MSDIKYICIGLLLFCLQPAVAQVLHVDYENAVFQGYVKNYSKLFIKGDFAQFEYSQKARSVKIKFFFSTQTALSYVINTDLKAKKSEEFRKYKKNYFTAEWNFVTDWTITNETSEVLGYKVIKASQPTDDGHTLFAWFAPDIPISAGPFMHSGLPGLILKVTYSHVNEYVVATKISQIAEHKFKEFDSEKAIRISKNEIEYFEEDFLKKKLKEVRE